MRPDETQSPRSIPGRGADSTRAAERAGSAGGAAGRARGRGTLGGAGTLPRQEQRRRLSAGSGGRARARAWGIGSLWPLPGRLLWSLSYVHRVKYKHTSSSHSHLRSSHSRHYLSCPLLPLSPRSPLPLVLRRRRSPPFGATPPPYFGPSSLSSSPRARTTLLRDLERRPID